MAARHPALPAEQQRRMLWQLANAAVRLQSWSGQPWSIYLRQCRETLRQFRNGEVPLWLTAQDSYAAWLADTEDDAEGHPGLARRRTRVLKLREKLLLHNQRMVIRIAHRKSPRGLDYSDLIMEGNVGLMRAVDLFDPRKNYRFSTYAHFWIEQSITLALKQKSHTVRTPLSALNRAWQERKALEQSHEGEDSAPTYASLGDGIGAFRETLSLDDPDVTLHLQDEDSHLPQQQLDARRLVNQLTQDLPDRLLQVLALRYGIEQKDAVGYREIADQLGISRERARQLEHEALQRVRRKDDSSEDSSSFS
ncbi:MAG: sigma-70 family RNA polymerase sigma factor [Natronospirillum sp.]|uniref:sigma-70 family RNA polymerase sigma factor n=1 Tax=Natronospirillum sp. TaxID=2812955 RepID=UPI00260121F6|nr:sigma-70 family RNA polymerase sigma factor [Natronospirillum sp.]MCH8551622.1 sigma-70 family RNA polymerase sigma factor [Natronospirillum sp.]